MLRISNTALSVVGVVITIVFTVIAIYTWFRSSYFSLPVSTVSLLLALLVPSLNHLGIQNYIRQWKNTAASGRLEILGFLATLDAVLIALASAQLSPGALECALGNQWRAMFDRKASRNIKTIQDALNCCGWRSTNDMASPFPDKTHGANACKVAFSRSRRCLDGWEKEEKIILALMITIGACSYISKILLLVIVRVRSSRSQFAGYLGQGQAESGRGERRGLIAADRYRDDAEPDEEITRPRPTGDTFEANDQPRETPL